MMYSHIKPASGRYLLTVVAATVAGIFSLSALAAFAAWSDPTSAPTGGNPDAPLHVGATSQTKAGDLGINGSLFMWGDSYLDGSVTPSDSNIALWMVERGTTGNDYTWKLWTSDTSGSGGLSANGFELWEYPDSFVAPGTCCKPRLRVLKSAANVQPYTVDIDGTGSMNLKGGALYISENPANGTSQGRIFFSSPSGNFHIDSSLTKSTYINWFEGSGGVRIGNGANAQGSLYARDVILKAYDGSNCYKVEVSNAGVLRTTLATC